MKAVSGGSLTEKLLWISQQSEASDHGFMVFTAQVTLIDGLPWGRREVLTSINRPLLLLVLFPLLLG